MANRPHALTSTPRARNVEPQPAPMAQPAETASTRRDLTSWWKQFSKRGNPKREEEKDRVIPGIFGVPLATSITYANVAISLFNDGGESYIYGYVPIVVAKCGVFLKEKATDVEGIFRLAGSEKRIKELKHQFDTPDRFGKGLDWTGYTVHDAANILRRYFNQLPEPIIPLDFYERFRQPLRNHQAEAVGHIDGQAPAIGNFNFSAAIGTYQVLIKELPPLNRQLLLYILDLLAVFAAKADINKMTTSNLAAIFQPGILSHPSHDMAPQEYRLSQDVLIFLIENQDHFLIGMEGTAVDERTVKEIESGPSTPQAKTPTTASRNKTAIGRSASSSSVGAESVRKYGDIRRNVSVSSRRSKHSAAPSPVTPSFGTPTGSGVQRSNTVPSKKSPAIPPARFSREKQSDPPTPSELTKLQPEMAPPPPESTKPLPESLGSPPEPVKQASETTKPPSEMTKPLPAAPAPASEVKQVVAAVLPPPPEVVSPSPSEETTRLAAPPAVIQTTGLMPTPPAENQAQRTGYITPTREKSEFTEGSFAGEPTTPIGEPISTTPRTFTQIFGKPSPQSEEKKDVRRPNKLQKRRMPSSANPSAHSSTQSLGGLPTGLESHPSPLPPGLSPGLASSSRELHSDSVPLKPSGATLKPTEGGDDAQGQFDTSDKKEKRRRRPHRHEVGKLTPTGSEPNFGSIAGAEKSMTSIGSAGRGRKSLQLDSTYGSETSNLTLVPSEIGNGRESEKKGPINWFREKMHERKEREAEKQRAKSPPGSTVDLTGSSHNLSRPMERLPARGKSMDVPRVTRTEEAVESAPGAAIPHAHNANKAKP
ncbi:RhoGAP-domain-containing protein [Cenococcum geophilum]